SQLGEFGLIDRIRRTAPAGPGVRIGIGDDAAWIASSSGSSLVTADLLIEDVHFDLRWTSLFDLGYKSLAVNLSDIAAMGGVPTYAILSLGIPVSFDSNDIDNLYRGINTLARQCGVSIVGGDTNFAKSLIISVCVIGGPPPQPVRRSGAKVGHDIYVTGTLGDSALGLKLLQRKSPRMKQKSPFAQLLKRHHQPTPRIAAGVLLARQKLATAMIDVSDGLLQDLGHICQASRIGAMIWEARLPLSRAYRAIAGRDGTHYALSGGEDYELLFCARPSDRARIAKLERRVGLTITRIGICVRANRGITVLDSYGKLVSTRFKGHDHFKKRRFAKPRTVRTN
ncbi:MAG TPA: thiamine-phosphate kinase, partial [Candidatus Binatia bacterium]